MCEVCGKRPQMGNQIETRGKAKYLGGVGTKITGISRRKFKPNLQRVKITTNGGENKTVRICTQCLRSGAVKKVVRQRPFTLPASERAKLKGAEAQPDVKETEGKAKPGKKSPAKKAPEAGKKS
jgi:large subunit ribosomal protein L28